MPRALKVAVTVVLALALGALGIYLVFVDIGPTETEAGRLLTGVVLFLVAGLALGFLNPEGRAWLLSGLAAWGLVLLGGYGLWLSLTHPPSADLQLAVTFLVGPLTLALLGGWLGARLRRGRDGRGELRGGSAARA